MMRVVAGNPPLVARDKREDNTRDREQMRRITLTMMIILLLVLPNDNLQDHMTLNWSHMTNQLDHVVRSQQEIDLIKRKRRPDSVTTSQIPTRSLMVSILLSYDVCTYYNVLVNIIIPPSILYVSCDPNIVSHVIYGHSYMSSSNNL